MTTETPRTRVNLGDYLLNLAKYCSVALNHVVPVVYSFYIFNLNDSSDSIKTTGLIFCFYCIFIAFAFDFFEPINTLCLPFLEKGNIKLYSQKVWKVGMFNLVFFVFGFAAFMLFKVVVTHYTDPLGFVHASLMQTSKFLLLVGTSQTTTNFCAGRLQKDWSPTSAWRASSRSSL